MVPGEVVSHDEIARQAKQNYAKRERAAHIAHADLVSLAKARPPKKVAAVVTSFSDGAARILPVTPPTAIVLHGPTSAGKTTPETGAAAIRKLIGSKCRGSELQVR